MSTINDTIRDTIVSLVHDTIPKIVYVTKHDTIHLLSNPDITLWAWFRDNLAPVCIGGIISGLVAWGTVYLTQRGDKENLEIKARLDRELKDYEIDEMNKSPAMRKAGQLSRETSRKYFEQIKKEKDKQK